MLRARPGMYFGRGDLTLDRLVAFVVGLNIGTDGRLPVGRSRERLYHEYFLWKQQLSFFNLDLERFGSSPPPDVISVDDAAAALGVPRAALFDRVAAGDLRVFRIGAELMVRRSDCSR